MRVRVLSFGSLREMLAPELEIELSDSATAGDAWRALREEYPALARYEGSVAIAVNESFATQTTALNAGDEVALLPPVSGGSGQSSPTQDSSPPLTSAHARLQVEPIDSAALLAGIKAGEDGAVCLFDGIVRNHTRNRRTLYLEYDSYPGMAIAEMEKLATEALSRFAVRDVRIVHRVCRLEIGESSVLIVVASAHRAAAFEACRWIIDTLKRTVPIWKKEFFADGATWADGEPFPPEIKL
jgi:MoaE-MoaD fusion protein